MDDKKAIIAQLIYTQNIFNKTSTNLASTFGKVKSLSLSYELEEEKIELLDSLASRYMRHYEILVKDVIRTMLFIIGEEQKNWLDSINQAEKQGFISNIKVIKKSRILRNQIVHEYLDERWVEMYKKLLAHIPEIIEESEHLIEELKKLKEKVISGY